MKKRMQRRRKSRFHRQGRRVRREVAAKMLPAIPETRPEIGDEDWLLLFLEYGIDCRGDGTAFRLSVQGSGPEAEADRHTVPRIPVREVAEPGKTDIPIVYLAPEKTSFNPTFGRGYGRGIRF